LEKKNEEEKKKHWRSYKRPLRQAVKNCYMRLQSIHYAAPVLQPLRPLVQIVWRLIPTDKPTPIMKIQ